MERKAFVVFHTVLFLGLMSLISGCVAEFKGAEYKESTASSSECSHSYSPGLEYALYAAVFLTTTQIIINVATGCLFCRQGPHRSHPNWPAALRCFVASWLLFVGAFLLLSLGAFVRGMHVEDSSMDGKSNCFVTLPGAFAVAGLLSGLSTELGIAYYLILLSTETRGATSTSGAPNQGVISRVHPPQYSTQGTVVVLEDTTYMRWQIE